MARLQQLWEENNFQQLLTDAERVRNADLGLSDNEKALIDIYIQAAASDSDFVYESDDDSNSDSEDDLQDYSDAELSEMALDTMLEEDDGSMITGENAICKKVKAQCDDHPELCAKDAVMKAAWSRAFIDEPPAEVTKRLFELRCARQQAETLLPAWKHERDDSPIVEERDIDELMNTPIYTHAQVEQLLRRQ